MMSTWKCVTTKRALPGARRLGSLAAVLFLIGAGAHRTSVTHEYRWMVADALPGLVAPPWRLVWAERPIWFEGWKAAGNSESPSRRIQLVGEELLTVMRKRLYAIDISSGSTRWSLNLDGDEIFDWKVIGRTLVYSSVDYRGEATALRGGVDLDRRTHAWRQRGNVSRSFDAEHITIVPPGVVIFAAVTGVGYRANHLVAVDALAGQMKWRVGSDTGRSADMSSQRFTFNGGLYSFVAGPRDAGLAIRAFSLTDGAARGTSPVIGTQRLGNPVLPTAVRDDGVVFAVCPELQLHENPRLGALGALDSVFAYSISSGKLIWTTQLLRGDKASNRSVTKLALSPDADGAVLAMVWPDSYAVLGSATGAIRKQARLPDYAGWSDFGALLYSHPYVYAGGRRARGERMAYDLVALDVDNGTIAWRYELEADDRMRSMARAEILNFIVFGTTVFVARADGMIMRFESAPHGAHGQPAQQQRRQEQR
jgi:outer membrane protein assembly factor BamB